jgi:hypothetical protein
MGGVRFQELDHFLRNKHLIDAEHLLKSLSICFKAESLQKKVKIT